MAIHTRVIAVRDGDNRWAFYLSESLHQGFLADSKIAKSMLA